MKSSLSQVNFIFQARSRKKKRNPRTEVSKTYGMNERLQKFVCKKEQEIGLKIQQELSS